MSITKLTWATLFAAAFAIAQTELPGSEQVWAHRKELGNVRRWEAQLMCRCKS